MADPDKKIPEINSIADEEALTEIDLGSFLSDKDSDEVCSTASTSILIKPKKTSRTSFSRSMTAL